MATKLLLKNIDIFVFDFDGVMTNNQVYIDQNGNEHVSCSRSDGLAFDVLRVLNKPAYILSTEENSVVTARAKKLKITAIQGCNDKVIALKNLAKLDKLDLNRILYIGNDLNDYNAMKICGYSACPADSHEKIKKISTITLNSIGGHGVIRELVENILDVNFLKVLYNQK